MSLRIEARPFRTMALWTFAAILLLAAGRLPLRAQETGGHVYYFPHLAVGASWQTTITYINYSSQEVSCQTDFLSDDGGPLPVSFPSRGAVVSRTDILPPGGSVHEETNVELGAPLAPGWARAACSGPLNAGLLFRRYDGEGVPVAEAGVIAATVPATRFVTFAEQGEGRFGTGVAYANPSDTTTAIVTFTVRDVEGNELAHSAPLTLLPRGHGARNMEGVFDLTSFTGSLEVTATAPIVSLSLNNEADPVISSLPPGELDAASQGSTTYYFPHLAVGESWQTTITYINYSSQEVSCQTDFLSDDGSPLPVSFPGRGTLVSRTDILPPGGSLHEETDVELSAPLAPGWARAACTGPLKASLLFRRYDGEGVPTGEAGVNAETVPARRFVTFAEQGEGQLGTGVAYANPSTTLATVTFTAREATGQVLASVDRRLSADGHGAHNMADLFDLTSFTGWLEITATEPIVSLSINTEADPVFSTNPVVPLPQVTEDNQSSADPFARWNDLEPEPWWRESAPYTCLQKVKQTSPWLRAGLIDLGGSDPLSLIRYFGNGSYLRYGNMGFGGCTELDKFPDAFHRDPPADPTYYSLGDLDIWVDIARVPPDASGWHRDDGKRVDMSMEEAVGLLNQHVAPYFRRISQDNLRMLFHEGNEFVVDGDGAPQDADMQQFKLVGACLDGCRYGAPGGLNRILLDDVASNTGGRASNGRAAVGLATFREANMEMIVHEMGHGWMGWAHSYSEVAWRPYSGDKIGRNNPYSNFFDIMSALSDFPILGWDSNMPSTLAINRYAAGWIRPEEVALHLADSATYTLSKPRGSGYQFLVVHSGRPYAFTTLEVLEERSSRFRVDFPDVYDPSVPGKRRPRRYDGVLVSRYDQTAGTGTAARVGPALYHKENPDFLADVGWSRDDYSLISDGERRDLGGGVSVEVTKNGDGSYEVAVSGGKVAEFEVWCPPIWFLGDEYDTGCYLDEAVWDE